MTAPSSTCSKARLATVFDRGARWSAALLAKLRIALGAILVAMVLVNVANAAGRYGYGLVFTGSDELIVYSMIWLVMTGMVVVTAEDRHLSLDALPARLGVAGTIRLALFRHALVAVSCGYAAVQSYAFVGRVARIGQVSMGLGIPTAIPHSALLVGFGLTALVAAALVLQDLATLFGVGGDDE